MKRTVISLFLIFHLFGILVAPNSSSYLFAVVSPIYKPYLDFLGIGNGWAFLAPKPVFPSAYFEHVAQFSDGRTSRGRFPEEKNESIFRDRHNRRMSIASYMSTSESNWQNMYVHYVCGQNQGATEIKLWYSTGQRPSPEMVRKGERKMTDVFDVKDTFLGVYYCEAKNAQPPN
jgi:hypothetical protein